MTTQIDVVGTSSSSQFDMWFIGNVMSRKGIIDVTLSKIVMYHIQGLPAVRFKVSYFPMHHEQQQSIVAINARERGEDRGNPSHY